MPKMLDGVRDLWTMSDMVKYRGVGFKKDQIAALYFTMSDIVHVKDLHLRCKNKEFSANLTLVITIY